MADMGAEPCWICGASTPTRCQACGTAGIDIFFCSKEHQRLVWPVHKLVCGPGKAMPFAWPLLSKEEVGDLLRHCDDPFPWVGNSTTTTMLRWLAEQQNPPLSRTEVLGAIRISSNAADHGWLSPDGGQQLLIGLREAQYLWMSCGGQATSVSPPRAAVIHCTTTLSAYLPAEMQGDQKRSLSSLYHRALFYCFLGGQAFRSADEDLKKCAEYTHGELQLALQSSLGEKYPVEAKKLADEFKSLARKV
ncbi:hypothetical protein JCM6882_000767 [Rhodosporidiobolus microsporus]